MLVWLTLHQESAMPTRTAGPPGFVTIAQAQSHLGCCRSTVEKLLRHGSLPAKRFGRVILIPTEALDRYVQTLPPAF